MADDGDDELVIEIEDADELGEEWGVAPEPPKINLTPQQFSPIVRIMRPVEKILDMPPPAWFIENLIPAGPVTVLHGESGSKKSFLLLDWMLCAATGRDWHGHAITPGPVLYIVAEGIQGMGKRIRAWAEHNDIDPYSIKDSLFVDRAVNLFNITDDQQAHWRELIRHLRFKYFVVDTLHMSSAGADENSSKDMGKTFANIKRMAGDALTFIAHHDPKEGKTARGSGSIRDDSDQCLHLVATGELTSTLMADRMKDAGAFKPIGLTFEVVDTAHGTSIALADVKLGTDRVSGKSGPTRAELCAKAITDHDIDFMENGERVIYKMLKDLDLGYTYGHNTVGMAIKLLRAAKQSAYDMRVTRPDTPDIEVET